MGSTANNSSESISRRKDPMSWIQEQIEKDADPCEILKKLIPKLRLPENVNTLSLWRIIFEIISEPPRREILPHVNSIDQVKSLVRHCKNIVILTGAGVSVSCGIPDFRSRDGIYARLHKDFPDLPNPQSMFDIHYFRSNQRPFFKFAKEIYPGQFTPSLCHRFIAHLDKTGRLLRNYSQNIDTLEQVAGIKNVVQCHGSFATASCMNCKLQVDAENIRKHIFQEKIPYCQNCVVDDDAGTVNILKPDIVFFGESLPDAFHRQIKFDKDKADLLIVIGSSLKVRPVSLIPSKLNKLKVRPVSLIPNLLNPRVPQILINREPLDHVQFDVEFYGNCDDIIAELCEQLGGDWVDVVGTFEKKTLSPDKVQKLLQDAEQIVEKDIEHNDSLEQSLNESEHSGGIQFNPELIKKDCFCNVSSDQGHDLNREVHDASTAVNTQCTCKDWDKVGVKKLKLDINDIASDKKTTKNSCVSNQELFYLPIPPNRYIFHGAELHLDDDIDSDLASDSSVSEADIDKDQIDNLLSSNTTGILNNRSVDESNPSSSTNHMRATKSEPEEPLNMSEELVVSSKTMSAMVPDVVEDSLLTI